MTALIIPREVIVPQPMDIICAELADYIQSLCTDEIVSTKTDYMRATVKLVNRGLCFTLSRNGCRNQPEPGCYVYYSCDWQRRRDLVQSIIQHRLGKSSRLQARSLILQDVPIDEYDDFMDHSHLYGSAPASMILGLYQKDGTLMTAMSYRQALTVHGYRWYSIRYATRLGFTVLGGASRLFTNFRRMADPDLVITYADKCTSDAGVYYKLGFITDGETRANYVCRNQDTGKYPGRAMSGVIKVLDNLGLGAVAPSIDRVWNSGSVRLIWSKQ